MAQPRIGFSSPQDAITAPRESLVYVAGLYAGTSVQEPDFLAVADVDPESPTYLTDRPIAHRCQTWETSCTSTGGRSAARRVIRRGASASTC